MKWPDDFPDEAQRGQTKNVRVTLQDVKRKSCPALDDAFAREVGDFDSLDALRDSGPRRSRGPTRTREADAMVRQQLIDEIIEANPFDVPPSWVNQMIDAYMQAYQIPESETRARSRTRVRAMAERQVRRDLIIDALAEREKLDGDRERTRRPGRGDVAEQRGTDPGQVYASLQKAGRLKEIERSITEEKVFEWL